MNLRSQSIKSVGFALLTCSFPEKRPTSAFWNQIFLDSSLLNLCYLDLLAVFILDFEFDLVVLPPLDI